MKIRGYINVYQDGSFHFHDAKVSTDFLEGDGMKKFTFELDVPHPLPELKVDVSTVEEVKSGDHAS